MSQGPEFKFKPLDPYSEEELAKRRERTKPPIRKFILVAASRQESWSEFVRRLAGEAQELWHRRECQDPPSKQPDSNNSK